MSAGSLVIVTKWKKSVTGTRNVLSVLLGYLVLSGNMRGRAAILHVAFIRFQLVCLFVRSHIACISSGEGVKELPGRHVKPQFCNFLLACSDLFFFVTLREVLVCMCLQVVVIVYRLYLGDLHKTHLIYTPGDVDG